jgi:HNH endonuclease
MLEFGSIPNGMSVLHKCDWRICCNPFHLFVGTQLLNMQDMRTKGRGFTFPVYTGEQHGRCVVTDAQVSELKALYATGDFSQSELSVMFKIGQTQVSRIIRGESRGNGMA